MPIEKPSRFDLQVSAGLPNPALTDTPRLTQAQLVLKITRLLLASMPRPAKPISIIAFLGRHSNHQKEGRNALRCRACPLKKAVPCAAEGRSTSLTRTDKHIASLRKQSP